MVESVSATTPAGFAAWLAAHDTPVVVDFWAPWCGPCRLISPVLEQLAAEQAGQVTVAKVNVDEAPELAQQYGIWSIPCVVRFDGGKETARAVGAMPRAALVKTLRL